MRRVQMSGGLMQLDSSANHAADSPASKDTIM